MPYQTDSVASLQNVNFLLRMNIQGIAEGPQLQAHLLESISATLESNGVPLVDSDTTTGARLIIDVVVQEATPTDIKIAIDASVFQNAILQKDAESGTVTEVSTWFTTRTVHHGETTKRPLLEDVNLAIEGVVNDFVIDFTAGSSVLTRQTIEGFIGQIHANKHHDDRGPF